MRDHGEPFWAGKSFILLFQAEEQHHSLPGPCTGSEPRSCAWQHSEGWVHPVPFIRVRYKGLWAECYRKCNILRLLYWNLKILEALELLLQGGTAGIGHRNWGAPGHLIFPSTFFFLRKQKCVTVSQFVCLLFSNLKWEPDKQRFVLILPSKRKS